MFLRDERALLVQPDSWAFERPPWWKSEREKSGPTDVEVSAELSSRIHQHTCTCNERIEKLCTLLSCEWRDNERHVSDAVHLTVRSSIRSVHLLWPAVSIVSPHSSPSRAIIVHLAEWIASLPSRTPSRHRPWVECRTTYHREHHLDYRHACSIHTLRRGELAWEELRWHIVMHVQTSRLWVASLQDYGRPRGTRHAWFYEIYISIAHLRFTRVRNGL